MTSFDQQYNDVVLTSLLQPCLINNIRTSFGRPLIDVAFTTLLQRHDMVERRRDVKKATIERRYYVVCLMQLNRTFYQKCEKFCFLWYLTKVSVLLLDQLKDQQLITCCSTFRP